LKFAAGIALAALASTAHAEKYPQRPMRMIVPFSAGGATDIVARALGQRLTEVTAQPIVIDNRGGAGGVIGTDLVAKAAPDGYTLLMATAANPANAFLVRNLPYDFGRDFTAVSLVTLSPYLLSVHPALQAKSVQELVALAKQKRSSLNYGSAGNGSSQHLVGIMFNLQAGTEIAHIPYKGSAPAITDLVGGQIQILFVTIPGALPFIKTGRIRPLAITSAKRSIGMPEVATISESGLPGFDMSGWFGLIAPRKVPSEAVKYLSENIARIVNTKEMKELLTGMGLEPVGNSAQEYNAFIADELKKYEKLVRVSGLAPADQR
jgi:tripartite-type tricarboxylate transporter receptor subunit TctC